MATGNELDALRRRRENCTAYFTRLSKKIDEIEQSGCPRENELLMIKDRLDSYATEFRTIQNEIAIIYEGEIARGLEIADEQKNIELRLRDQLDKIRLSTSSKSTKCESAAGSESAPEARLPTFDGTLENWRSFYDSFSSMIDRNEQLTPFQKLYYLRSTLTGKAARAIQSLDLTESNYSIAINILRDKFDCHRQICVRHWHALLYYPKMAKETPEAVEDLIETVKINLKALEEYGDPPTSNTVICDLITSKLPQSTVRKWHRTLPNKEVPEYTHLIDFLQTRIKLRRRKQTHQLKR